MYKLLSRSINGSHKKMKMFSKLREGRKGKDRKNKQKTHNQMTDVMISIMLLNINGLKKPIKTDL